MASVATCSTEEIRALARILSFPHPVNEVAARMVAGMVSLLCLVIVVMDAHYLCFVLTYGFLASVLTGPTLSPAGLLATKVLVPVLGNPSKLVAGPPKRFAQTIGLFMSGTATTLILGFGLELYGEVLLLILSAFAMAESVGGFCFGCYVFGLLMRLGVIPEEVCERCANLDWGQSQE